MKSPASLRSEPTSPPVRGGRRQARLNGDESPALNAVIDERREQILKAAEGLFFKNGYARTTMEQIVHELGVTKPYVYYYFHNKQEIFETLCWRPCVACFTVLDFPLNDARPAHEKLVDGLGRLVRATIEHYPSAFFWHLDPQALSAELSARQTELANRFYDRLCALLERARRDGTADFNDTKVTALAACSLPGFLFTWYRPDGPLPPEAVAEELTQLVCRVLGMRIAPVGQQPRRQKQKAAAPTALRKHSTQRHARLTFAHRLEMVREMNEHGLSAAQAAARHGVTQATARKWFGRYLAGGEAALAEASAGTA
jgi:AcrR family transcriptional regulator